MSTFYFLQETSTVKNNNHLHLPALLGILKISLLIMNLLFVIKFAIFFTNKASLVISVATDNFYSIL